MDLRLSEEQEMLKTMARDYLEKEYAFEVAKDVDADDDAWSPEHWRKAAEMGWQGLGIPEEYGGTGGTLLDMGVLFEELGRGAFESPMFSTAVLGAIAILEGGTDQQKKELLPAIADGKLKIALAFTEPEYGWDPANIKMEAKAKNGNFVLNGTKLFVPDVAPADKILCAARTSQGADPKEGITLFLIDKDTSGLSAQILKGEEILWEHVYEVTFNNVEVPKANVLGQVNKGWEVLEPTLLKAAPILCAYMVGGLQKVYDLSIEYCRTRIQFGVPIGTFQRVQDRAIEIVNGLDASRLLTYEALWKLTEGKSDAVSAVSLAKAVTSDKYYRSCDESHDIHAGTGVDMGYPLYLYTKTARTLYYYLGDPHYHRAILGDMLEAGVLTLEGEG
jgi:alkylation response protein AidB-like acyl-CoA dehydrogenase